MKLLFNFNVLILIFLHSHSLAYCQGMSISIKLNTGADMPLLGLGTWQTAPVPGQVTEVIKFAIDTGYRHIDCAHAYGNENEVGIALKEKIGSVCDRKDIFITSKLWNTKHYPEDVIPALKQTLSDLQLDYVDLYLIHWPTGFERSDEMLPLNEQGTVKYSDVSNVETWKAMEECVHLGLAKNIGLSNFNSKQVEEICSNSKIKPAINQVELHPYLTQPELVQFCRENDIVVTAYSPLGSPDRPWAKPGDPDLLADQKVKAIADTHGKTPAQVLIRFHIERKCVVIPKSSNNERIVSNFDVFKFQLSPDEMLALEGLNKNFRGCKPCFSIDGKDVPLNLNHPYYPFFPY